MTQKLADQGQTFAVGETSTGEGMAQVVDPDVVQTRLAANDHPGPVQVRGRLLRPPSVRKEILAAVWPELDQKFERRLSKRYDLGSRLGILQAKQPPIQIQLRPLETCDLALARPGQGQKPEYGDVARVAAIFFERRQDVAKAG
ncbi:hypothetical protein D3C71_1326420 [compost metagenome]